MIEIRPAVFPEEQACVQQLFRDYADSLDIDLSFQGFAAELAALPGNYAPPSGRLLLAWRQAEPVGCIALRPLDDVRCEMKRLYVKPSCRGLRLGHALASRLCAEARAAGYRRMLLDTLPTMGAALHLYAQLGFQPTAPYVFNPIDGALFLACEL
jgi:ribosomal protein S18 acetylase RimI-like enzyme